MKKNVNLRRLSFFLFLFSFILAIFLIKSEVKGSGNFEKISGESFVITGIDKKQNSILIFSKNVAIIPYVIEESYRVGDVIKLKGKFKKTLDMEDNKNYGRYLKSRGCDYIVNASEIRIKGRKKSPLSFISSLRENIRNKIEIIYQKNCDMAEALIIGDRRHVNNNQKDMFAKAGISHIISISGFHIVLFYSIFFFLFSGFDKRKRYVFSLLFTLFYVLMSGMRPPSIRAYVFLATYILSIVLNQRYDIYSAGFVLISFYLMINPYIIYDAGFVLSFLSVFSISMFSKPVYNFLKRINKSKSLDKLFLLISVTLASQILTMPYVCYNFKILSLVCIFTNIISVPLISIVYPFLICSVLFFKIPVLCKIFSAPADILMDLFFKTNEFFTSFSFSAIEVENMRIEFIFLYYLLIFILYFKSVSKKIEKNMIK